jgi:hypothetical protein
MELGCYFYFLPPNNPLALIYRLTIYMHSHILSLHPNYVLATSKLPTYLPTYLPTDLSFTIAKVKTNLNSGVRPAIPSPPTPSMSVSMIVYLIQQVSVHKPKLHPFYYVRTLKIAAHGDGLRE